MINLSDKNRKLLEQVISERGYQDGDAAISDALKLLQERGTAIDESSADSDILPGAEWKSAFRHWAHSHQLTGITVDDSRESIYALSPA